MDMPGAAKGWIAFSTRPGFPKQKAPGVYLRRRLAAAEFFKQLNMLQKTAASSGFIDLGFGGQVLCHNDF